MEIMATLFKGYWDLKIVAPVMASAQHLHIRYCPVTWTEERDEKRITFPHWPACCTQDYMTEDSKGIFAV